MAHASMLNTCAKDALSEKNSAVDDAFLEIKEAFGRARARELIANLRVATITLAIIRLSPMRPCSSLRIGQLIPIFSGTKGNREPNIVVSSDQLQTTCENPVYKVSGIH